MKRIHLNVQSETVAMNYSNQTSVPEEMTSSNSCVSISLVKQSVILTSHLSTFQLCLLAKCFKPALPFLELDMMDICKENGAYDAKHFLCYYYYGGMIYTGLKNFDRALYFYEQVLFSPLLTYIHNSFVQWPRSCFESRWSRVSHHVSSGNNHSSHGSEPHHVGSL